MIKEIQIYCEEKDQNVPETPSEIAKCVFDSLAKRYQNAIGEIEEIYEKEFPAINDIGGGSQNEMLNQLIADTTVKEVIAGPSEATATGNIAAQLIALNQIKDIKQARTIIQESFELKKYKQKQNTEG